MTVLASARVTQADTTPRAWMLFLHGILGSGGNWRTFARRLVAARPAWGAVLVDLRLHGHSQGFPPPHTLAACADDLRALVATLDRPVHGVIGHSFGGKVALAYLRDHGAGLEDVFVLDSAPGGRVDARAVDTTRDTLALLDTLPTTFPTRESFLTRLTDAGSSKETAQWLAMNLQLDGAEYRLRMELPAIRALMNDYFAVDLWPVVENPPGGTRVHFVVGGRSDVFTVADRERAAATGASVAVLPDAGHWLHVDDPDGLLREVLAVMPV